jgi:glycosyltransferase involved in cell wall biosynthesis
MRFELIHHLRNIPLHVLPYYVPVAFVDVVSDPGSVIERFWPYRFFRRALGVDQRLEVPISVIVATWNNAGTLKQAVTSILKQTHRNLAVIIVDDNSDDSTSDVAARLMETDDRVQYIKNSTRIGAGLSRNVGMRAATGKYVTFQDGDDVSELDRIERQCRVLEAGGAAKFSLCRYVRVNERGERLIINDKRVMKCIISMMFPREEVLEKVGYFIGASVSEDADYYERIKIALGADTEKLVQRTLYKALFRPNSSFFESCDSIRVEGDRISFVRKASVAAEWALLRFVHMRMRKGEVGVYVPYT